MPAKKYRVCLSEEERSRLEQLTRTGRAPAYAMNHARILLKADEHQPGGGWVDAEISAALDISVATIERVRQRFVEEDLEVCLKQRRRVRQSLLDGEQESHLIALACSPAPEGHTRWTLRLLAERLVELEYVESISHETVRQTLKKTHSSRGERIVG